MSLPQTLGELRRSKFSEQRLRRRVKDEMRENLIARLRKNSGEEIFPGIIGYEDTVVPQVVNAERYQLDLGQFPTLVRIYGNCMKLGPFIAAHPSKQPDYEP